MYDRGIYAKRNYKNREQQFNARLILQGYSHKFNVLINETEIFFE